MKIIKLPNSTWFRGNSAAGSALVVVYRPLELEENIRDTGKSCCLGICLLNYGVNRRAIKGIPILEKVPYYLWPVELIDWMNLNIYNKTMNDENLNSIYDRNDTRFSDSDQERVDNINEALEKLNAPFRFEFDPEH